MDWEHDVAHLEDLVRLWWAGRAVHEAEGVDCPAVFARLRARARTAASRWDLASFLREALWHLGDGHLRLEVDWPPTGDPVRSGLDVVDTPSGPAVAGVAPRLGQRAVPGHMVVDVDGRPVEEHLASVRRMPGSTPRHRRWNALVSLSWQQRLPGEGDHPRTLTLAGSGQRREVALRWEPAPLGVHTPACVTGRAAGAETGVLTVRSFLCRDSHGTVSDAEFARQLDAATTALEGARRIVVDLRWNSGGRDEQARMLASRCIAHPITWMRYRHRLAGEPDGGFATATLRPTPHAALAGADLRILVGPGTVSTAEIFAAALSCSGRALLVGETTAGSVGNPIAFRLPRSGLSVQIPVSEYTTPAGQPIEGHGLAPDVVAPLTADDLRAGRDSGLDAAMGAN